MRYPQWIERRIVAYMLQGFPPGGPLLVVNGLYLLEASRNALACCLTVFLEGGGKHWNGHGRISPNREVAGETADGIATVERIDPQVNHLAIARWILCMREPG